MCKKITFDVMIGDRFYATLRMPVTLDVIMDYHGDQPVIDSEKIKRFVERKLPTIKNEKYHIEF